MTTTAFTSAQFSNENQFQAGTNRFINANFPELRHFYFHIPNESATSDQMRMKLSAMGVLPGVPDIIFLKPTTWFIELKMAKGTLSERQKHLHKIWESIGIKIFVCRTPLDVIAALNQML